MAGYGMTDEQRRLALLRAADLIEEFGWTRGTLGMPREHRGTRGPLCFLGSAVQAAYDLGLAQPERDIDTGAEYVLGAEITGIDHTQAWLWNDDEDRQAREVVHRLRDTAASLAPAHVPTPVETLTAA